MLLLLFYYFWIEQVRYGDPSAEWSYSEDKKDSIRAYKPVSEGPVKVDAKSKDSIVVRPAEDGEHTRLEAIDASYTYVLVDKQYVFIHIMGFFIHSIEITFWVFSLYK